MIITLFIPHNLAGMAHVTEVVSKLVSDPTKGLIVPTVLDIATTNATEANQWPDGFIQTKSGCFLFILRVSAAALQ